MLEQQTRETHKETNTLSIIDFPFRSLISHSLSLFLSLSLSPPPHPPPQKKKKKEEELML